MRRTNQSRGRGGAISLCALVVLCTVSTDAGLSQSRPVPTSDSQIAGRVVRADNGAPVQGAKVEATGPRMNRACCYSTTTDANGEYRLEGLPDDPYILTVFAAGFVANDYHPSGRLGGDTQVITASSHRRIDFQLQREAVISGIIVDTNGEPAGPAVTVQAVWKDTAKNGTVIFPAASETMTESDGHFALRGLPAGSYFVRAFQPMGGTSNATPAPLPKQRETSRPLGAPAWYRQTWYGDSPGAEGALQVSLRATEERNDLHITMPREKRYAVTIWLDGAESDSTLIGYSLMVPGARGGGGLEKPRKSFVIRNVSPGHYTLECWPVIPGRRTVHETDIPFDVLDADMTVRATLPPN